MFEDVAQVRRLRKQYNVKMLRSGISTFREFEELEAHALCDAALTRKHKELIALAIGISSGCYG